MKTAAEEKERLARRWVELIVAVWSCRLCVTEAARKMEVSRKTFYQKEARALEGMLQGLMAQEPGRPRREVDVEKEALRQRNQELEELLRGMEQRWHIREVLSSDSSVTESGSGAKKKVRPSRGAERTDGEHEGEDGSELPGVVPGVGRGLRQPHALAGAAGPRRGAGS